MSVAAARLSSVISWHRPLIVLAAAMALSTAGCLIGLIADDRMLTGVPIWMKPLKFSLSVMIYAFTWAFLIHQLRRARRVAWWAGTVSAIFLAVEMVIIIGQAARGTTSHFNNSTSLNATLYTTMAGSIVAVWVATLIVSILLFVSPGPDRARNLAIRWGAGLAVVGMALGFLMTIPSAAQIKAGGSVIGAHTVGLADGGAGLPLLGWSTVGGDLRIPHFVGMHALQIIPLLLVGLELLGGRLPVLRDAQVRARLIVVAGLVYLGGLGLLTGQALRGQSIVHPDALTGLTAALLLVALVVGVLWSVQSRTRTPALI